MFCIKCGKENPKIAKFCYNCGSQIKNDLDDKADSQIQSEIVSDNTDNVVTATAKSIQQAIIYAGFWKRFAASIIDELVLFIPWAIVSSIVENSGEYSTRLELFATQLFWSTAIYWAYHAILESSVKQATYGKMALGIKVTDINGNRISFGLATARHFAGFISFITLCVGYFMAGWTKKKQCLHDIIAGTLVVNNQNIK